MRPPFLLAHLVSRSSPIAACRIQFPLTTSIPILSYPVCRRNFGSSIPLQQDSQAIMTDPKTEETILPHTEPLAGPASAENEILGANEGREEALKETEEVKKEDKNEEEKLPKLSAADFAVYNSMAEHMEYFVCLPLSFLPPLLHTPKRKYPNNLISITISDKPGPHSTPPASITVVPPISP